jgi:NAD(P)-dependent dehydrogenase (short-subunit alcohol dehydrogenase family)
MKKTVIITGATRGIGKGLFDRLSSEPFNFATIYHSDDKSADFLKNECIKRNIDNIIEKLDVKDFEKVQSFVDNVANKFGRVDYLVNNIGTDIFKTIYETTFEDWKKSQDIILNAPFILCKAVLPIMRHQQFGRIINIGASSKDYLKGAAGLGPFAIHKAALTVLTKTLALEEIKYGITVNMVAPGSTKDAGTNPEEKRISVSQIPIGRRVDIDEVVEAILYFLSDKSGSTTGQFIGVNGGLST